MATRLVLGTDNGGVTTNFKRPVIGDLASGAADSVLQSNAAGTGVEWEKVRVLNMVPGFANTVLTTNASTVVAWSNDFNVNNLNVTGILRYSGQAPATDQIAYSASAGAGSMVWKNFKIAAASYTNVPYRTGASDTTTMCDVRYARQGSTVQLRFLLKTITVVEASTIALTVGSDMGTSYSYSKPVIALVNGTWTTLRFTMGNTLATYYPDNTGLTNFAIGDVVQIPSHDASHIF